MKRLGNTNLFTSAFVMGSCESELKFTKTNTIEIEVLHKWMDYKDSDWGMKKYQTKRTQYISFPHLIDLQDLSLIIQDLMRIYKLQYPYATKEDFIDTVFGYSIFDIKNFIESEYTWYGGCPNINEFDFYYTYERIGSELIDFILDADKDIDYYKQYFKKVLQLIEDVEFNPIALVPLADEQKETKTDKLKVELGKYGFFELPKVKQLSEPNKQSLVELISTSGLPYSIAMFDFLDFFRHIETEHFRAKYKLNKEVAKWFNSDKEGRAVKGNISSLSDFSTENKSKYTAHTHKETVKTDYQKLK